MTAPLRRFTKADVDRHVAEAVAATTRDQLIASLNQRADDSNHLADKLESGLGRVEVKVHRLTRKVDAHQGYFVALGIPSLSDVERSAFPKMLRLALKLDWLGHGVGKAVAVSITILMVLAAALSVLDFFIQHVHP